MKLPLQGKVALVTGGSRGIGASIAERLAADGAAVAITYSSSRAKADVLVAEIRKRGGNAIAIGADSADASAVADAIHRTARELGRLDILVNNAGVGGFKPIAEVSVQDYDSLMAVNVRAVFVACKHAAPLMSAVGGGRIINIGSTLGERAGFANSSVYVTSKAAVAGMTRALARELGPFGITVNVVEPGPVETDLNPAHGPGADLQRSMLAIPRFAKPFEIASVVAFLAGPESSYVTGASMLVDGGFAA